MSMFIGHKVNKQHAQALRRLKEDTQLLMLFTEKLNELYKTLGAAEELTIIYRTQGKISVLKDLLESIEKSTEYLER